MLCLMICNMTPIPLVLSHHIASCLPPGDPPFPPRFALALTLVANGAAVKGRPVVTTERWEPSVEHLQNIHMLYGLKGRDEASFPVYMTVQWLEGCPFLTAAKHDCWSDWLSLWVSGRKRALSCIISPSVGWKHTDENLIKNKCQTSTQPCLTHCQSALIECHSISDLLLLLMKVKSN